MQKTLAIATLVLASLACSTLLRPAAPATQVVVLTSVTPSAAPAALTAPATFTRQPPSVTPTPGSRFVPDLPTTDAPTLPAAPGTLRPSATRTPTARATASSTRGFAPTATGAAATAATPNTFTRTFTPAPTATGLAASATPTHTLSPEGTTAPASTPSRTPTSTPTALTASVSSTPTPTATTVFGSATPTRTVTPTPTSSPTLPPTTATFTYTPTTIQPTPALTITPTLAPPTATFTPTPVPPTNAPTGCQPQANGGFESEVVALINVERANAGLGPLSEQSQLTAAARLHSNDMACNHFFSHTGSDGSTPFDRMASQGYSYSAAAENIAGGYGSPADTVAGWMNSAGHRANILGPYVHIGVGYTYEPNSDWGTYWTATFGSP